MTSAGVFCSGQVLECIRECPQYAIRECNELYHILTHPFFGVSYSTISQCSGMCVCVLIVCAL